MELYHTQTREDYNALMDDLDKKGFEWLSGHKPHEFDGFEDYGIKTVISVTNELIEYFSMDFYKENYNEVEIIEYKADKSEKEEILKLKKQVEISKAYFQNILEVNPNIRIGSPNHLVNCVNVMKNSAENALKRLKEVEDE